MDDQLADTPLARARAAFLAAGLTIRNLRRDFTEWHRGRPHYGLWALMLDRDEISGAVTAAQRHLGDQLLPGYRRQPHITVALGGFPCATARHADDYPQASFTAALAALRTAAPQPFTLEIGGLASFTSAPFLAVDDVDGGIAALRRALLTSDPAEERGRAGEYVPHLTVGLYAGEYDCATVADRLAAFPAPQLRVDVCRLAFVRYDSADVGGPLTTAAEYVLADGSIHHYG
jgi:2'-5' RNA ligase